MSLFTLSVRHLEFLSHRIKTIQLQHPISPCKMTTIPDEDIIEYLQMMDDSDDEEWVPEIDEMTSEEEESAPNGDFPLTQPRYVVCVVSIQRI